MKSRARRSKKRLLPDSTSSERKDDSLVPPDAEAPSGFNQLRLSAHWVEQAALRYTPAGVPALDLVLEHRGQAMEAGHPRRVELRIRAVALGELAGQLQALKADDPFLWSGFLAPARNGKGVVFHITQVEPANV